VAIVVNPKVAAKLNGHVRDIVGVWVRSRAQTAHGSVVIMRRTGWSRHASPELGTGQCQELVVRASVARMLVNSVPLTIGAPPLTGGTSYDLGITNRPNRTAPYLSERSQWGTASATALA